ncbi:MAG TPA: dihydropteroate synthase [Solirubrobacteraceae bacterium]
MTAGTPADFQVMGILNVTPDSFSDGGRFTDVRRAVEHGLAMEREGASMIDVGGESTRPGADPVSEQDELARVVPVIEGLRAAGLEATISIDTSKAAVAAAALDAGAELVNDVSALRADAGMAPLVAARNVTCVLMHMRGEPRTMQRDPRYEDVVGEVRAFLQERLAAAIGAGIDEERIWLDPGIGFGKTVEHNLELLRQLPRLTGLGRPIVIGTSRKSFLGTLTGRDFTGLAAATVATSVLAYERGARVFRVHDVAPTRDALIVSAATVGRA